MVYDANGYPLTGPTEHPRAAAVLTLGVLGLLCCGLTAPIAWVMGARALREIDASGGYLGGRSQARLGMVLGIVGTILVICMCLLYLLDACTK